MGETVRYCVNMSYDLRFRPLPVISNKRVLLFRFGVNRVTLKGQLTSFLSEPTGFRFTSFGVCFHLEPLVLTSRTPFGYHTLVKGNS